VKFSNLTAEDQCHITLAYKHWLKGKKPSAKGDKVSMIHNMVGTPSNAVQTPLLDNHLLTSYDQIIMKSNGDDTATITVIYTDQDYHEQTETFVYPEKKQ